MTCSTEVFAIDTGCHETFKMKILKKLLLMPNINDTSCLRASNRSADDSEKSRCQGSLPFFVMCMHSSVFPSEDSTELRAAELSTFSCF